MIKLIKTLIKKYSDEECLYFSWDAASWHSSKLLYKTVKEITSQKTDRDQKIPSIKFVPLPSRAQFLNVIESIFSGMARAIIHNSDYQSVEEAMKAIDRYFIERNQYFKENPKRAGNKIWGKERVPAKFSESNNCKDPLYR
jgi:DDE superfamily endonuclease